MKFITKTISLDFLTLFVLAGCKKDENVKIGLLMHAHDKERWENDDF